VLLGCLLASTHWQVSAQAKRQSTSYFSSSIDGVIAQLVDGGSWKTIITLVNLDTTSANYTLRFYSDSGTPLSLDTSAGSGSVLTGTLPVGGSRIIETAGTKATLSQGWALLETSNRSSGNAIFRQSVPGRPDFEASMPIVTYVNDDTYFLPFDNVTSSTGVAIANPLSYTGITVYLTFRDEQGNQILIERLELGRLAHTAFSLAERFPQSAGRRGVVEISTSALTMSVLGLRFGAQSFTSLLPLTR